MYAQSHMTADAVLEMGCAHVVLATGAKWRRDLMGRVHPQPINLPPGLQVVSPDQIMAGQNCGGPVVIYDDDRYYMGSLLAELLRGRGLEVTLITPDADIAAWSHATLEQGLIAKRLYEIGVRIVEKHAFAAATDRQVVFHHTADPNGKVVLDCGTFIPVTSRLPNDSLYHDLMARQPDWAGHGLETVTRIGDGYAPSTIAAAVYAGHRYGRELGVATAELQFNRELF